MKPQDVDIENELSLLCAVVTAARRDALSKNKKRRRLAVNWLNAMRLPVTGPVRQTRIGTRKGKRAGDGQRVIE